MTVYVDVVFMENLFMNYIILFATAVINKVDIKLIRILLSSILGSIYAVVSYTDILSNSTGIIIKILLSIAMIYIAFKPEGVKKIYKAIINILFSNIYIWWSCICTIIFCKTWRNINRKWNIYRYISYKNSFIRWNSRFCNNNNSI